MPESLAPQDRVPGAVPGVPLRAPLRFRDQPSAGDPRAVRDLTSSSGFFSEDEIAVAVELVDARLVQGLASGYHFIFAEREEQLEGYACFGPIPLTQASFDLYWIAVHPLAQQTGVGRQLMDRAEAAARALGAVALYVETSARSQYEPTRSFYRALGYRVAAELPDFYGPGDGQVIFAKRLRPS